MQMLEVSRPQQAHGPLKKPPQPLRVAHPHLRQKAHQLGGGARLAYPEHPVDPHNHSPEPTSVLLPPDVAECRHRWGSVVGSFGGHQPMNSARPNQEHSLSHALAASLAGWLWFHAVENRSSAKSYINPGLRATMHGEFRPCSVLLYIVRYRSPARGSDSTTNLNRFQAVTRARPYGNKSVTCQFVSAPGQHFHPSRSRPQQFSPQGHSGRTLPRAYR